VFAVPASPAVEALTAPAPPPPALGAAPRVVLVPPPPDPPLAYVVVLTGMVDDAPAPPTPLV
jgi:hypothetical protein